MTTPLRVLIVEDCEDDAQLVLRELRRGGYEPIFEMVETAEQMQAALNQQNWELILCDYALPGFSAPKALELLTDAGLDIPFIVVSGRIGEKTAVEMMRAGAHDYMMKDNLARLTPTVTRELAEADVRRARKRAEEALHLAAQQWETTFDGVADAVCLLDADAKILQCNSAMAELVGKPTGECIGRNCCELVHGSPKHLEGCPLQRARSSRRRETMELAVAGRWLQVTIDPLKDDEGQFTGAVHIVADITERKRAQEEIGDLAKFPAENPDPVLRVSGDGTISSANKTAQPLLDAWSCRVGQALPTQWAEIVSHALVTGHREDVETECDGRIFLITFAPVVEAGYINLYGRDITDRKLAGEALRRSEERYRALFEQAADTIVLVDSHGQMVEFNDRAHENLGYTREEFEKLKIADIEAIEFDEQVEAHIKKIVREGSDTYETKHRTKSGEIRDVLVSSRPIDIPGGNFLLSVWHDITDSKQAQEALRQSEQRYRHLFEHLVDAAFLADADTGVIIETNHQGEELLGRSRREIVGMHQSSLHPSDKAEQYKRLFAEHVEKDRTLDVEAEVVRKDGRTVPVRFSASTMTIGQRRLMLGIFRDITDRKRTEESLGLSHVCLEIAYKERDPALLLREFVAEVQAFTRCAGVGIRLLDEKTNIPYEAYTGFSEKFYESESPLSIESDECMCINVIKGDTDPGLPFYTEGGSFYMNATTRFLATVSQEDKGQTRNVCNEFGYESVALVPITSEGRIVGLIHVADPKENMVPLEAVNVLEKTALQLGTAIQRVAAEQDVRRSHKELRALAARLQAAREEERILLARKIHDDVGHNLAALKRELAWLGGKLPKAAGAPRTPNLGDRLKSMSKLLAETIQTARETASDLRPGLLDDVSLAAAIEWEAKQFQRRTGVKCRFTDAAEQTQFDREQSTALFRICQELLANIANHAGATAATIALKKQADELILEVSDNGKGIEEEQISSSRSLGILGMRERALVMGGEFSICGKGGKGTTATVQIPLGAPARARGK